MNGFYLWNKIRPSKWQSCDILIAFIAFTLLNTTPVIAQDRIILKDGKEIKARILGTDDPYLRYKRFDNPTGPDYFIFKTDVLRFEYEKDAIANPNAEKTGDTMAASAAGLLHPELRVLEEKAARYRKKGNLYSVIGTGAIIAGIATLLVLKNDYNSYKKQIQNTNDTYINWYKVNYGTMPDNSELAVQKSFGTFSSPGIYAGVAAIAGGLAFELLGFKNIRLKQKTRKELQEKQKQISFHPFYQNTNRTGGISLTCQF